MTAGLMLLIDAVDAGAEEFGLSLSDADTDEATRPVPADAATAGNAKYR